MLLKKMNEASTLLSLLDMQCNLLLEAADYLSCYSLENNHDLGFLLILRQTLDPITSFHTELQTLYCSNSTHNLEYLTNSIRLYERILSSVKSLFFVSIRAVGFFKAEVMALNLNLRQKAVLLEKLSLIISNNHNLGLSIALFYHKMRKILKEKRFYPLCESPRENLAAHITDLEEKLIFIMSIEEYATNNTIIFDVLDVLLSIKCILSLESSPFVEDSSSLRICCLQVRQLLSGTSILHSEDFYLLEPFRILAEIPS